MTPSHPNTSSPSPQALATAQAAGAHMEANDSAGRHLGITLLEISPGAAKATMTVRNDMLNGHGTCHGGITYTLADTVFAYTCNSHGKKSVALACSINYSAPAFAGDVLTAVGEERSTSRKTGVYDVTITNQAGTVVAVFRGQAYRLEEPTVPAND